MRDGTTVSYQRARKGDMPFDTRQQVVASLEGMRIVIDEGVCRLDEYDYVGHFWEPKEVQLWPMSKMQAEQWLQGWNGVDGFKALHLLIRPHED